MVPYNIVVLLGIILVTARATPLPPFVTAWTTEKMLNSMANVANHVVLPKDITNEASEALIHSQGMDDNVSKSVLALSLKTGKKLWSNGPWISSAVHFNSSTVLLEELGPDPEVDGYKLGFSIVDAITGEILLSRGLEVYNDSSVVHLSSSDSIYLIRRTGYSGEPRNETINTILRLSGPSYDPESPAALVTWTGHFPFSGILRTAQRAGLLIQYEGTNLRSLNPIDLTER